MFVVVVVVVVVVVLVILVLAVIDLNFIAVVFDICCCYCLSDRNKLICCC